MSDDILLEKLGPNPPSEPTPEKQLSNNTVHINKQRDLPQGEEVDKDFVPPVEFNVVQLNQSLVDNNYPDNFNEPRVPWIRLQYSNYKKPVGDKPGSKPIPVSNFDFKFPDSKVQSFNFVMSSKDGYKGSIVFFDTYEQGQKRELGANGVQNDLLTFLSKMFLYVPTGSPGLVLTFGWQGDNYLPQDRSPVYNILITNADYQIGKEGVICTLSFIAEGYEMKQLQVKFKEKTKIKGKTPYAAIVDLVDEYNKGIKTRERRIFPNPILIECDFLGDSKLVEKFKEMKVEGKTFSEIIDTILGSGVLAKNNAGKGKEDKRANEISMTTYSWWIQKIPTKGIVKGSAKEGDLTIEPGENDMMAIVIFGMNPLLTKDQLDKKKKRRFFYRGGKSSNIIDFSYKAKSPMVALLQGMLDRKGFVKAFSIDEKSGKMVNVRQEEGEETPDGKVKKMFGFYMGDNKPLEPQDNFGENVENPKTVNIADSMWDKTKAGKLVLDKISAFAIRDFMSEIDITIIGDPNFIIGGEPQGEDRSTEDKKVPPAGETKPIYKEKKFSKEEQNEVIAKTVFVTSSKVVLGDVIQLDVIGPSGVKDKMLSGYFMVMGFTHDISFGTFTTKISAVKVVLAPEETKSNLS
jgi:hypothetical protein